MYITHGKLYLELYNQKKIEPFIAMWTSAILENAKLLIQKYQQHTLLLEDIVSLKQIIDLSDHSYYVKDQPVLADVEYDALFAALKQLEKQHPEAITADSPTQRVAVGLTQDFVSADHLVPMLSLENSYDLADLQAWHTRCQEALPGETLQYSVEYKYDGAGISLLFENDQLQRAATRGDGVKGDDITINAKQIKSIPLRASFSKFGIKNIEIRGEVLITKSKFDQYNATIIQLGQEPLANPRNAASGALRMKDPGEVAKRGLDAFLYHVSYVQYENDATEIASHSGILNMLTDLGFRASVPKVFSNVEDVFTYIQQCETDRDNLPFEIDGMVIKIDSLVQQEKIGQTSHHPRWAMAFKFKARQATSKLIDVEYQVGRTGSVTPVGKIEPVHIGGVTVTSISLHNNDMIQQKDLRIGDTVLVERAGDVIPYIVKSFPELRKGIEKIIEFPTSCPICEEQLHKPDNEVVWRCVNIDCKAQVVERIIHFASKDAMDIRGLGDANIKKFFELGVLTNIIGIYNLPYSQLKTLEGLGAKSIDKLEEAIEKSKTQPLSRIIYGLGIRYVGETTAKTLAASVSHISDLATKTMDDLKTLDDVGEKVAASIIEFFSHQHNRDMLLELETVGLVMANTRKNEAANGSLSGKSFLFTGSLTQFKRSDAESLVEAKGGTISGSVSSKLNYLVVGEDAGSKLEKAKKLGTVAILSESEFLQLLDN